MYGAAQEDVFYYLTLYNENDPQPPMPPDVAPGIIEGLYRWAEAPDLADAPRATIVFSGSAQGAARRARDELAERWGVPAELWSATSYKRLREQAMDVERWNRLHPGQPPRSARVTELLSGSQGPVVAVTDFMRAVPDQVARWIPAGRRYTSLGTDGFGRSDTRAALRRYFETDAGHVGRLPELADLAAEIGLDRDDALRSLEQDEYLADVQADLRQAGEYGISGVPFFVFDGKYGVSGAQAPETFHQVLQRVTDERAAVAS